MAHFCSAFAVAFQLARDGERDEIDERMKNAYHEELDVTLSLVAAYQSFAISFRPHGQSRPLLDPQEIWLLRGIEAQEPFVPPPLPPEALAVAEAYEAPRNAAYR